MIVGCNGEVMTTDAHCSCVYEDLCAYVCPFLLFVFTYAHSHGAFTPSYKDVPIIYGFLSLPLSLN